MRLVYLLHKGKISTGIFFDLIMNSGFLTLYYRGESVWAKKSVLGGEIFGLPLVRIFGDFFLFLQINI